MKAGAFRVSIKNVVHEIWKKHFPRIRYLFIVHRKGKHFYMALTLLPFGGCILSIDNACRKIPADALEALIVHELVHKTLADERACDMEVIRMGYGKELLAFHDWHNKRYKAYKKHEGLTRKEVSKAVKEFKSIP